MIVKSPQRDAGPDTGAKTTCTHCGLPVPAGLIVPQREPQFCCGGCEGAYDLIHGSGLESFYRMADADPANRASVLNSEFGKLASTSRFGEFDEAIFQEKYCKQVGPEEAEIDLAVEGIHCGACVWLLEKLPMVLPGVVLANVNWAKRTIRIRWRNDDVTLSRIATTLQRLGYRPSPIQENQHRDRWNLENRKHLTQIGIAAACAGNNMIISLALYLGMFSHMDSGMTQLLRVASCVVGMVALLWPGRTFLKSAWGSLRTMTPHMDLPIALGLSVGTLAGLANVIRGIGEIYFDSLAVLIFLLLIGRWIQFRQQSVAANSVEMLYRLTPQVTRKIVAGEVVETLVDLVQIGDTLQIRGGDLFPVDGEIAGGDTRVDESILTGESNAVLRAVGDPVAAGTLNVGSVVTMRTTAIGRQTRLSQIVELVEQASLDKPQMVLWANRIGGWFVATVILLATLTFFWWIAIDVNVAIDRAIALLIVACPCALALATPLTLAVAIGRAARQKTMIKGGDVLQSLQQPGMMWLDKTGTLTDGDLKVVQWFGDTSWLKLIAALEEGFSHPVAKAIVQFQQTSWDKRDDVSKAADRHGGRSLADVRTTVLNSEDHAGLGVSGKSILHDVAVGSARLMSKLGIVPCRCHLRIAQKIIDQGCSPCWIAVAGRVVGLASIGDSIRPEAASAIDALRHRGWQVGIFSGDHQQVVDRVAKRLGIAPEFAIGETAPEAKLKTIQTSATQGNVVMVGDGVNDSAALAAASVGIAVKNGAEASLAAAPVYLGEPGLNPILNLLAVSDSTGRTMRRNLGVSLAYNLTFAGLAFAGYINPLVAAILMPISSITVVALSLGSGRVPDVGTMDMPVRRQRIAHVA